MTPEGKEMAKFRDWLKASKLEHIRLALQPCVPRGWPDILVLPPGGMPIFIEMKAPGAAPNDKQKQKLAILDRLGYIHGWFDNADAASQFIIDNVAIIFKALDAAAAS